MVRKNLTHSLEDIAFEQNAQADKEEGCYGFMKITYNVKLDKFTISGNIKKSKYSELLGEYLRSAGGEVDKRRPRERQIYHITLRWYPSADRFETTSDTGNKGLREGILMRILRDL